MDDIARIAEECNKKELAKIEKNPIIDENSRTLVEQKRGDKPIYERLYAKRKEADKIKEIKQVCVNAFYAIRNP